MEILSQNVPQLTNDQMRKVDQAMTEDLHIELIQMMENAGRNLAHLARVRFLEGNPIGKNVILLAGRGGNGGGALVCARRLHNWGASVQVLLGRPPEAFNGVPGHQLDILTRMRVPLVAPDNTDRITTVDLIVDGLIGYNLSGAPRGTIADLIRWANKQDAPILALDVPSGVDTTTGTVFSPAIRATATMTLALPKKGLGYGTTCPKAREYVGELYLADISVPPELYASPALDIKVEHLFAQHDIVRLR